MQRQEVRQEFFLMAFTGERLAFRKVTVMEFGQYQMKSGKMEVTLFYKNEHWHDCKGSELAQDRLIEVEGELGEPVTLYLQKAENTFRGTGKVNLEDENRLVVGSDYGNTIYYEFYRHVKQKHIMILFENGIATLQNMADGCYVNGQKKTENIVLHTGDRIQLYGLELLFLHPYVICLFHMGRGRLAGKSFSPGRRLSIRKPLQRVEFLPEITEELRTEEVEILLPRELHKNRGTPAFLSLGPSLTMMFPMLLMSYLNSTMNAGTGKSFYYVTIVTGICSTFFTLAWGIANYIYGMCEQRKEARGRCRQYRDYLQKQDRELADFQEQNRRICNERHSTIEELLGNGNLIYLRWNRQCSGEDFLFLRLGTGKISNLFEIKLAANSKKILPDYLTGEAMELKERYEIADNMPIGVHLQEKHRLGIEAPEDRSIEILFQILVQLTAGYRDTVVKLACFYDEECDWQKQFAEGIRWVPHCWSTDGSTRFVAGNREDVAEILPTLTKEISESDGKPYYVVFLLNEELLREEILPDYFCEEQISHPVSVIGIRTEHSMLDGKWDCCIQELFETQQLLLYEHGQGVKTLLEIAYCNESEGQKFARKLSQLFCTREKISTQLPEKVDFLELFGCHRMEELESENRWKTARPEKRLKVPIGKAMGNHIVYLDVHEKFHGPHGLIAGTTGSGKSELLQTYLLSLAVCFSPQDVTFFMIDYKGGGTGNFIKNLPHCAGVVSNLSGSQIRRAMLAISSENRRRQQIFSQFEVNHIDAYTNLFREGKASFPLPHLLIVVDEFAELKREEPDFMQKLISLAQVGRSLGVHLLLATQKPAGTVDDKIWSNARFRLCLKVQDRQDSMDMLHQPDASLLTKPGQCYLQIGNNELYQYFQTGYCGGNYHPQEKKQDVAILLSKTGERYHASVSNKEDNKTKLIDIIIDYVNKIAEKYHYKSAETLWMEELPESLFYEEIENFYSNCKADTGEDTFFIGIADDPENQCRKAFTYAPLQQGHLVICGGPSTGKSTLLHTLLEQMVRFYNPREMSYLLISLEEQRNVYADAPHCIGYLEHTEGVDVFFCQLVQLAKTRKKQLAGQNYREYRRSGKKSLPILMVCIDDFSRLRKKLRDEQEEALLRMVSEGIGIGMFFVMTGSGTGDFPAKLFQKIKMTIALEMSDPYQYGDVMRKYHGFPYPKSGVAGRGLCKIEDRILEFQTALFKKQMFCIQNGDAVYPHFRHIPLEPEWKDMEQVQDTKISRKIPVAYNRKTGEVEVFSLERTGAFLISGGYRTGKTNAVQNILSSLCLRKQEILLIDFSKEHWNFRTREGVQYVTSESEADGILRMNMDKRDTWMVVVPQLQKFTDYLSSGGQGGMERTGFWEKKIWEQTSCFVIGSYHPQKDLNLQMSVFFKKLAEFQCGIHLGGNVAMQRVLEFDDLAFAQMNVQEKAGDGVYKNGAGSGTKEIRIPLWGKEEEEHDACGGGDTGSLGNV